MGRRAPPWRRPATLGRLELVSHGEHLRQAADSLERAPSPTQRELRAHTLAGTFRALGSAGGGPLAERVAEFAQAARGAVARGAAVNQPALFAAELRRAGDILSSSGGAGEDEAAGANALAAVTTALRRIGGSAGPPAEPPGVPIESLAPPPARAGPALSTPADRAGGGTGAPADIAGSGVGYKRMGGAGGRLRAIIDEVCDLVVLAIEPEQ